MYEPTWRDHLGCVVLGHEIDSIAADHGIYGCSRCLSDLNHAIADEVAVIQISWPDKIPNLRRRCVVVRFRGLWPTIRGWIDRVIAWCAWQLRECPSCGARREFGERCDCAPF